MSSSAAHPRSPLKTSLAVITLLIAAPLAYGVWQVLPGFAQLFAGFGPDVPAVSHWLTQHPQGVWTLLRVLLMHNLLWLGLWLWRPAGWRGTGLSLATALTWLALAGAGLCLYLPMFTIAV